MNDQPVIDRPRRVGRHRRSVGSLLLVAALMFGFAFALVPLYRVFCELTGLNGRIPVAAFSGEQAAFPRELAAPATARDVEARVVEVQFLGQVATGLPWEFRPLTPKLRVRLGQSQVTRFYVRNRADRAVTGQAVPSVSPGKAALHLHKTECFCFTQQALAPGEEMEMGVAFIVDEELPEEVQVLSLSYTFFPVAGADPSEQSVVSNPP